MIPNSDKKNHLFFWHISRLWFTFKTHVNYFFFFSCVRAALNMKEFGQIVLIKMHIIPDMQVKFPIKIPLHSVLVELLFTPSCNSYHNIRAHVNVSIKNHCQNPIFPVI